MSRILVTGGCGFIGGHVVDALLRHNHCVMVIDNLSSGGIKSQPLPRSDLWFREWDILDLRLMDVIFHNFEPECVVHLAAQPSLQTSWKAADFDAQTNIIGTINLLGLCQRYKVKRFVFASTSAVYAPKTRMPYVENDPIGPQTPYGVSKAAAEYYIQISGLSYAILRLGNVYGPGQVPLGENQLIPRALAHIYQGEPFVINGDGEQRRDFVYVKDVAKAFVQASEQQVSGIYNIACGKSTPIKRIVAALWSLADFPKQPQHGSEKPGELRDVCLYNYLARVVLGWKPMIPLARGLQETLEAWPKEQ